MSDGGNRNSKEMTPRSETIHWMIQAALGRVAFRKLQGLKEGAKLQGPGVAKAEILAK